MSLDAPSLQEVFEKLPDSVLVTDPKGNIVMANPALAQLLGVPLHNLIGQTVGELVKQGLYQRSIVMEAVRKKKTVTGVIKTATGRAVMSTSVPVLDEKEEVRFVISHSRTKETVDEFIRDLERKKTNSDLERYRREIDHLRNREKNSLVFRSPQMGQVVDKAEVAAGVACPVLLLGESGVGKDVIANYIHRLSSRASEAFIVVNCAAMPENLIESELFGYTKGAFSGADANGKYGLVELADKGTLFLDEVAEIPLSLQAKFLRVLETYECRRLGSVESRQIDFRLIAATNRDLKGLVAQGKFREDLYYRLSVFPIKIPPLRERREDIPALLQTFLAEFNKKYGAEKRLSQAAVESVLTYDWPGNVRELRNVVERRFFSTPGDVIECARRSKAIPATAEDTAIGSAPLGEGTLKEVLQKAEIAYINRVLQENGGHCSAAAKKLGIHRTALWRKIKEEKTGAI